MRHYYNNIKELDAKAAEIELLRAQVETYAIANQRKRERVGELENGVIPQLRTEAGVLETNLAQTKRTLFELRSHMILMIAAIDASIGDALDE